MPYERKISEEHAQLLEMIYDSYGEPFIDAVADLVNVNGMGDCYDTLCSCNCDAYNCIQCLTTTVKEIIYRKEFK